MNMPKGWSATAKELTEILSKHDTDTLVFCSDYIGLYAINANVVIDRHGWECDA